MVIQYPLFLLYNILPQRESPRVDCQPAFSAHGRRPGHPRPTGGGKRVGGGFAVAKARCQAPFFRLILFLTAKGMD